MCGVDGLWLWQLYGKGEALGMVGELGGGWREGSLLVRGWWAWCLGWVLGAEEGGGGGTEGVEERGGVVVICGVCCQIWV